MLITAYTLLAYHKLKKVYVAIFDFKFSLSKLSCEFSKNFSSDNEAGIALLAS